MCPMHYLVKYLAPYVLRHSVVYGSMELLPSTHADPTVVTWVGCSSACVLVSLFVCLSFLHDISTTDAARITKPDTEMFHHESWKRIYSGSQTVKGQGHEAQQHCWRRSSRSCCECWLLLVGYNLVMHRSQHTAALHASVDLRVSGEWSGLLQSSLALAWRRSPATGLPRLLTDGTVNRLKPRPYQQQCWCNRQQCRMSLS